MIINAELWLVRRRISSSIKEIVAISLQQCLKIYRFSRFFKIINLFSNLSFSTESNLTYLKYKKEK